MSIYEPLCDYLRNSKTRELIMNFAEIGRIIGRPLPKSAERPQFWANQQVDNNRPQRKACREAGYDTFLIKPDKVRFVKTR